MLARMQSNNHSRTAGGNVKCYRNSGKQFDSLLKYLNIKLSYVPATVLLGTYPRENKCMLTQKPVPGRSLQLCLE